MGDRIRLFKEVYPDRKQLEADAKIKQREEREWQKQKEYMKTLILKRNKQRTDKRHSLDEIQDRFLRGENISALIRETLLTNRFLPASPVALLQNTNPQTVCYMNSVLQCIVYLPGFVGCENWPFKVIDEGDDLKKSYKRLHRWRYSPTAAYGNNEVHLHPYKARRISAAEALAHASENAALSLALASRRLAAS
jgi:site-specific DNA-cytosine methylase